MASSVSDRSSFFAELTPEAYEKYFADTSAGDQSYFRANAFLHGMGADNVLLTKHIIIQTDMAKDTDWRDSYGLTPLLYAVGQEKFWFCQLLLERGANPNATTGIPDGASSTDVPPTTPLTVAVSLRNKSITHLLLNYG